MRKLVKYIVLISVLTYCNNSYCTDDSPYIAAESFTTERLNFRRIRSAQQDIESYKAICDDSGFRNSWFMDVPSRPYDLDPESIYQYDVKCLQEKDQQGFYKLPLSFADYNVYDSHTQELVGRFILKNEVVKNGRIEKGIYVLKKFRKNGFSVEILSGILREIIQPAIAKPFTIGYCPDFEYPDIFQTKRHNNFQGVFSNISPWYNYPSLASSHKAGCVLRWQNSTPVTFYPSGDEAHMDQYDVKYFKEVIQDVFQIIEFLSTTTSNPPHRIPPSLFFTFLAKMEKNTLKDNIIKNLHDLLITDETYTIASTIEALTALGETSDHLRNELFQKKLSIYSVFQGTGILLYTSIKTF